MKQLAATAILLLASLSALPSASAVPVQCHGPLDGYQTCEVEQGSCHAGETYWTGDVHAHAECQPTDGKSRCGIDAAYDGALLVTWHCGRDEGQLWPPRDVVAAPAASSSGTSCQEYPGYERCDHTAGPCTVTTYYYYHDAFYAIDGPHCGKPGVSAAGADQPVQCWGLDGLLACEVTADPCHAGFRYERGEVEDVHAQCFS